MKAVNKAVIGLSMSVVCGVWCMGVAVAQGEGPALTKDPSKAEGMTNRTIEAAPDSAAPDAATNPSLATPKPEGDDGEKEGGGVVDPKKDSAVPLTDAAKAGEMGPGGRPLRTDYPGTDEAMRSSMETDRIKGVATGDVSSKEVYDMKVRELETRIDDLKDRVFRSKSRIVLLKETLMGNKLAGAKAVITHRDEMGDSFRLKRMTYILDNNPLRNEVDRNGSLADKETVELFNGAIAPGTHNLVIELEYQGKSSVFNYFDGYVFSLTKACQFKVDEGKATVVNSIPFRKEGVNVSIEKSPSLKCEVAQTELQPQKASKK